MKPKFKSAALLLATTAAVATSSGALAQACDMNAEENKLTIASTDGVNHATPFFVAQSEGFFDDACLNLTKVTLGSAGAPMLAALAAGDVDVSIAGAGAYLASIVKGITPGKIIGVNTDSNYMMLAREGIDSPSDLAGKAYGISGINSGDHLWSQAVVEHYGVGTKDVNWIPVGNPATRLAALMQGSVDAIQMNGASAPPEAYEHVIVSMDDSPVHWLANGYFARQEIIDTKRDALVRLLAAIGKGAAAARADSAKAMKGCMDSGSTEKVCETVVDFVMTSKNPYNWSATTGIPRVSVEEMVKAMAESVPELQGRTAEDVADFTIAAEGS
ncbi:ABC transporter substrate-binding protein [Salipiger sp.]|uniref:ABC transporter substrate-binding protein n=1 Tax=Salipiger sp. TaxID=2078585 RepID=UPI003A970D80